jgi:hypothetical protein
MPMDPRTVLIREISKFHRRNFIATGGAVEFWIAKIIAQRMIPKLKPGKTCINLPLRKFIDSWAFHFGFFSSSIPFFFLAVFDLFGEPIGLRPSFSSLLGFRKGSLPCPRPDSPMGRIAEIRRTDDLS